MIIYRVSTEEDKSDGFLARGVFLPSSEKIPPRRKEGVMIDALVRSIASMPTGSLQFLMAASFAVTALTFVYLWVTTLKYPAYSGLRRDRRDSVLYSLFGACDMFSAALALSKEHWGWAVLPLCGTLALIIFCLYGFFCMLRRARLIAALAFGMVVVIGAMTVSSLSAQMANSLTGSSFDIVNVQVLTVGVRAMIAMIFVWGVCEVAIDHLRQMADAESTTKFTPRHH